MNHHRFAVDLNHAARGFTYAKNQMGQLRTPGADQPGQPDDLAGTYLQAARLDFFAIRQVMHVETRTTQRDIALFVKQVAERTAHHHAHQLGGIQFVARQAADVLPVTQDAHAVRKLIHFRHAMADVDDCHPLIAQAQNQFKQAMGFTR
ncbi:hypothetical protein D3C72_1785000 [compost metagenome]